MASIFTDEDTIKLINHIISKINFYSNSYLLINNLDFLDYQADKFFDIFLDYDKTYQDAKKKGLTKISKDNNYTQISIEEMYNLTQEFLNFYHINLNISNLVKDKKIIINNIKEKLENKEITEEEYNNLRFNARCNKGLICFNYCGDIIDCIVFLHEITHLRNEPLDFKTHRTEINDFITESIAYAEEFIFLDFLKTKGYEDDYNNYLCDIFYNCLVLSDRVYYVNKILYVYKEKGNIFKDSYTSIFKNHKNYEQAIKELYKLIISKNSYIELIWTFLGYISGLYLYIMYLEDHNYFKIVEELNEAITNEKCTWQNIFRILKVNKPEDLFKIMFEKIDYFVKNETLKLKQSR